MCAHNNSENSASHPAGAPQRETIENSENVCMIVVIAYRIKLMSFIKCCVVENVDSLVHNFFLLLVAALSVGLL